ncbi:MAG: substrate-binding domain-containing protein [Chloroflexota bacterium]|nr:MAG: anti-anti-sigma factor [Chloroflexota bacterium]
MTLHPRIGCFVFTRSTFWSMLAHGVTTRAAEFGARVEVHTAQDVEGQDAILAQMIRQRVDAMVLGVIDPVHGAQSAREAAQAGIPVIAVVAELPGSVARSTIRVDDIGGAQAGAEHLASMIGGRGAVAHLHGTLQVRTGVNRAKGFRSVMARYPEIRIVYEGEGSDWSREAGQRLMREALAAHPEIAGVFAASDGMALGALDVIEEAGRSGTIAVVGFDGQPEGLAAVHSGRLAATVDQPAYTIGWTAADTLDRLLKGEDIPTEITIPSKLITPQTLLDSAMQIVSVMPGLFQSLMESSEAQRRLHEEMIAAQRALIQELSAPILPLADDILALPLVGAIDTLRATRITEELLNTISETRARAVIVDISGVPVMDTGIANHLLRTASAARLLGTTIILVGISPEIAQTIVQLGIDFSGIHTFSSMREGLIFAQTIGRRGQGQPQRR